MNYYEILGVKTDASPDEIKQAFAAKVRTSGRGGKLAQIEEAFDTLIYPPLRSKYDISVGLLKAGENAGWRNFYHTYSAEFIERDRAYKYEFLNGAGKSSPGQGLRIIIILLSLAVLGGLGALGYLLLNDKAFLASMKKTVNNLKSSDDKNKLPVVKNPVDFPDLIKLFPAQAGFIGQKINNACVVPLAALLTEGADFAVYWIARYNCEQLAMEIVNHDIEFKQIEWSGKEYDPVSFARLFGARAVAGIYEKYKDGRFQNIRISVADTDAARAKDLKEVTNIKSSIEKLKSSIHFYKAEQNCADFSDLSGSSALLVAYQAYYDCLQEQIAKEQEIRQAAGHKQIPK